MRWYECPLWYKHMYRDICVNAYVCPKRTSIYIILYKYTYIYINLLHFHMSLYPWCSPERNLTPNQKMWRQHQKTKPKDRAEGLRGDERWGYAWHASAGSEKRQVCHMLAQSTNGYTTLLDAGKTCVYWLSSQLLMCLFVILPTYDGHITMLNV